MAFCFLRGERGRYRDRLPFLPLPFDSVGRLKGKPLGPRGNSAASQSLDVWWFQPLPPYGACEAVGQCQSHWPPAFCSSLPSQECWAGGGHTRAEVTGARVQTFPNGLRKPWLGLCWHSVANAPAARLHPQHEGLRPPSPAGTTACAVAYCGDRLQPVTLVDSVSFWGMRVCVLYTEALQDKSAQRPKAAGRRSVPAMQGYGTDCCSYGWSISASGQV